MIGIGGIPRVKLSGAGQKAWTLQVSHRVVSWCSTVVPGCVIAGGLLAIAEGLSNSVASASSELPEEKRGKGGGGARLAFRDNGRGCF